MYQRVSLIHKEENRLWTSWPGAPGKWPLQWRWWSWWAWYGIMEL